MNTIDTLLNQLETKISHCETVNPEISNGNVAWHIEHSLLTLEGITDFLIQSNPDHYKWRFNFIRIVVLTMKKFQEEEQNRLRWCNQKAMSTRTVY